MNKKLYFMAVAAASLFASACSNNESAPEITGEAVEFRAVIDKTAESRASLVSETAELTSFFVSAGLNEQMPPSYQYDLKFMNNAVWRSNDGAGWAYGAKKYFPAGTTSVNFFAYSPIKDINMGDGAGNNNELQIDPSDALNVWFDYTVPNDQSESNTAVDLLVASKKNVIGNTVPSTTVGLTFEHALSAVMFKALNMNPEGSELVYTIHSIEISALANTGTFYYKDGIADPTTPSYWVADPGSLATYKAGVPQSGVAVMPTGPVGTYVNLLSANDLMMVMPQTPEPGINPGDTDLNGKPNDADAYSYVLIEYSLRDGYGTLINESPILALTLPSGFKFKPGTLYNFQFSFKESSAVEFDVIELTGWGTTDDRLLN